MIRLLLALGFTGVAFGCSASSGLDDSTGSGSGANGAGAGSGTGDGTGGGNIQGDLGLGTGDVTLPEDDCGGDVYRGESSILDMYILMDRSGSMLAGINIPFVGQIGSNVWQPVGTAIGDFVTNPANAGMSAGIGFFPLPPDADEPATCDITNYSTPAANIGALPGNGPVIQNAIIQNGPPSGGTPTVPAMTGAMQFAKSWATQNASHKVIIVLATDGEPNDCSSDVPGVAQIAADGIATSPRVETYVIGIGNVNGLNEIAAAGGSNAAIVISNDAAQAAQEFSAAMNAIRGRAIPCDFGIPAEGQGALNLINLKFSSADDAARVVPKVTDANACGSDEGWYYDDDGAPSRIIACPTTCSLVGTANQAQVNVVVGCEQIVR